MTDTDRIVCHIADHGDGGFLVHANVEGDTVDEADTGVTNTDHLHLLFDAVGIALAT